MLYRPFQPWQGEDCSFIFAYASASSNGLNLVVMILIILVSIALQQLVSESDGIMIPEPNTSIRTVTSVIKQRF